jgi:NAD+ synthetase
MKLRVVLAQINPTVGDIAGNLKKMQDFISLAQQKHVDLVIFPELSVVGYPPMDLLEKESFVEHNLAAVETLAKQAPKMGVIVGFVKKNPHQPGMPLLNCAGLVTNGKLAFTQAKTLLPSYDVFDETRYFQSPQRTRKTLFRNQKIGISICEDIWNDKDFWERRLYTKDPIKELTGQRVELIVNISASPFAQGKGKLRYQMIQNVAKRYSLPIIYVNQVGGNDSLIFDGGSFALDERGRLIAQAKRFEEDFQIVDFDSIPDSELIFEEDELASLHQALLLGIRDYVQKTGFTKVLLGLSGGIDSSLTCLLAVQALGKGNVYGVLMPSPYSSESSVRDAKRLAHNLGIDYTVVPIGNLFSDYNAALAHLFEGMDEDVTEENIQARIRGTILMALSNKFGYLLLSTGNKSELAMGYCTLYGDMAGGLAVISDLPKTLVYRLAGYLNRDEEWIPKVVLTKVPSAELRPNQKDEDSLPPYTILDEILHSYIEENRGKEEIVDQGFDPQLVKEVLEKVDRNEYKRRQAPLCLRVTSKAFGFGRRIPIAQRFHH